MTDFNIEVKTPDDIKRHMENIAANFPGAIAEGLWKNLEVIRSESVKECPVDTGRLRASAWTYVEDDGLRGYIGYTANYAVFVHENLTAYHGVGVTKVAFTRQNKKGETKTTTKRFKKWGDYAETGGAGGGGVTKAKFLEDPVRRHQPKFLADLMRRVMRIIKERSSVGGEVSGSFETGGF